MYSHADQSWRQQPAFMSDEHRRLLATRIAEYARENDLKEIIILFHGGEPLLAGAKRITETADWIRKAVPEKTRTDFSLQTNGTILTEEILQELERSKIGVSISLDGPKRVNDLHRLGHDGFSTFAETTDGLRLLEKHPSIYCGIISVIDPTIAPQELLDFFAAWNPPSLDFLLPDANHNRPPAGREKNPELYKNWLLEAFDLWFDSYSHLSVRMFDAVLGAATGFASETDAFGFGDVNLLTIETDGTYHDLDVLKITAQGATSLGLSLESHKIEHAAASKQIGAHRGLLQKKGLSAVCLSCEVVDACGGGAVAHRFSKEGFENPTVYCEEMFALLKHAKNRLAQVLTEETKEIDNGFENFAARADEFQFDLSVWEAAASAAEINDELLRRWAKEARRDFAIVLNDIAVRHENLRDWVAGFKTFSDSELDRLVVEPAVQSWTAVYKQSLLGVSVTSLDGIPLKPDPDYVVQILNRLNRSGEQYPRIHHKDVWLCLPFGRTIVFEEDEEIIKQSTALTGQALEIIESFSPELLAEIGRLSPDIQFVSDPEAHPDQAVSLSDNSTPGALYVGVEVSGKPINPFLLADSIIHEHRHQKLYLLQREATLLEADAPLIKSPWRSDPRPPSGLLHALFVFVCLHEYWLYVAATGPLDVREQAAKDIEQIRLRIDEAFPIMRGTKLTKRGLELVDLLESKYRGVLSAVL